MAPLLLLLVLTVQPAARPGQPEWRPLGTASDGRPAFYDPASVVRAAPVSRVRLRFEAPQGYSLGTAELRCARFEARVGGMVSYAADGRELGRNELMTPFRAIAAGGFLEALAREVCGAATAPARPD